MRRRKMHPTVVIMLLLIAVAAVVGGSIAGNDETAPRRGHSAPSAGERAEQDFQRNLKYEVAENMLEEEGYSEEEAEEARGFAEREHVGAQGAIELGAAGKVAGRP